MVQGNCRVIGCHGEAEVQLVPVFAERLLPDLQLAGLGIEDQVIKNEK